MPKSLAGNVYGDIKAVEYIGNKRYKCQCIKCGNVTYQYSGNLKGHMTCKKCGIGYRVDYTGKTFGYLTVESYDKSTKKWLCRCKCGNKILVRSNNLQSGNTESCGCKLKEFLDTQVVEKTRPAQIRDGEIINSKNTSGYTGVYFHKRKNKWYVEIKFQKKRYYLGSYTNFDDAVLVRKIAENRLHGDFFDWYNELKANKQDNKKDPDE